MPNIANLTSSAVLTGLYCRCSSGRWKEELQGCSTRISMYTYSQNQLALAVALVDLEAMCL